jgi:hypothetical protein
MSNGHAEADQRSHDYPWSAGEWVRTESWAGGITEGPQHIHAKGQPALAHVKGKASAELIALAPEMAATLLTIDDAAFAHSCDLDGWDESCAECAALRALTEATDKLRAIIKEHTT